MDKIKKIMKNNKITLEAIEQDGCDGCFFDRNGICFNYFYDIEEALFACTKEARQDGKEVIFKLKSNYDRR